jgi:nicotinamide-nucleotide amidase
MREPISELLRDLMVERKLKLAVAESLTCGNLQAIIGSTSGASDFFEGGITTYSLPQKVRHLGVDKTHAKETDCVSQRVAWEMAKGACEMFGVQVGIGTTGYAEPQQDKGIPAPYAYFAICHRKQTSLNVQPVDQGKIEGVGLKRVEMQRQVTQTILLRLVKYLITNDAFLAPAKDNKG